VRRRGGCKLARLEEVQQSRLARKVEAEKEDAAALVAEAKQVKHKAGRAERN
jgi:hypothetical protein